MEGKSHQYISQRLRFGRFLAFSENSPNGRNLLERRFREYWERSKGTPERQRFRAVCDSLAGIGVGKLGRSSETQLTALSIGAQYFLRRHHGPAAKLGIFRLAHLPAVPFWNHGKMPLP